MVEKTSCMFQAFDYCFDELLINGTGLVAGGTLCHVHLGLWRLFGPQD